ncbi:CARDB domain-containing protein [Kineococcus aurantiacus]|uniref:CARDB domain-containing protein n=1 Tax=Kineococcus aurantiacus TaxID=37633 RepID=A0A7Y9DP68_9ACTN|nr:CARDB domain-containing protein [Kineococcus aurantiacus]NYD24243.1 hypothetical protein [Kineococcus aurantiacus]
MRIHRSTTLAAAAAVAAGLLGAGTAQAAPARPDLVVTKVTWAPQSVAAGQQLAFSATIKNQGTAATPADVIHGVGFQVDGKLRTWSDYVTWSLAPGESTTVVASGGPTGSSTWTATTGTHEILAYVDDAGRIAESNESNNRTKTTFTVAAKPTMTTSLRGLTSYSTFPAVPGKTGIASYLSGTGYGACFVGGRVVPGTEKSFGTYGAGNTDYYYSGPFSQSGKVEVPARATSATSAEINLGEIYKWHYGDPEYLLDCAAGQTPDFTRWHVTKLTTNRWTVSDTTWGGNLLATATATLDVDLPL